VIQGPGAAVLGQRADSLVTDMVRLPQTRAERSALPIEYSRAACAMLRVKKEK
jgi:hypothetical protein